MTDTKGRLTRRCTAALICALLMLAPLTGANAATIEYTVTATKVNLREEATTASDVVAVLRSGTSLTLISENEDGWLHVSVGGETGYLSSEYACLTALTGSGAEAAVLTEKLNIRASASPDSKVLKVARRGSVLSVLELTDGWLKVTSDGTTGYVSPEYVKLSPGNEDAVSPAPTSTPAVTAAPGSTLLKKGARGDDVRALQEKLIQLGYLTGSADGVYGNNTVSAVKAFQKNMGLTADGEAGASTLAALNSAIATPVPTASPTPVPTQAPSVTGVLKKGARGDEVISLQKNLISLGFLSGSADGIYGNNTVAAVKAFQRSQGLTADGTAGASTLAALNKAVATPTPVPTATPSPVPTQTPDSSTVLEKGDRGDAVRALQEKLIALGFLTGSADGIFGSDTRDAVKAFQRNYGIDDDGKAGPETLAALESITVAPSNPSQPDTSVTITDGILKKGSSGDAVKALQEKLIALGYLSGNADGYYGSSTIAAVKSFQKDKGLTVDGIAGTSTIAALNAASGSTGSSNPTGSSLLKYGDKGDAVKALQTRLKELGYFNGTIGGNFGSITRDAVKAFQTAARLTNDGIAGEATLNALFADDAPVKEDITLRAGDSGDAVKKLQARLIELGYLTGSADGSFGSATQAAVMAFQSAAGLTADGVAGESTQSALYSDNAPMASAPSQPDTDTGAPSVNSAVAEKIIATAKKYLGCKYVYACEDPPYFDCSGLTQYVFKQYGYSLLRTAYQQGYNDKYQKLTLSQLKMGDLVFFNTNLTDSDMCDHTGIYIGNGDFIHASSSAGKVIISNLNSGYYNERFSWGRRILTD